MLTAEVLTCGHGRENGIGAVDTGIAGLAGNGGRLRYRIFGTVPGHSSVFRTPRMPKLAAENARQLSKGISTSA